MGEKKVKALEEKLEALKQELKTAQEQASSWNTRVVELRGAIIEFGKLLTSLRESKENNDTK